MIDVNESLVNQYKKNNEAWYLSVNKSTDFQKSFVKIKQLEYRKYFINLCALTVIILLLFAFLVRFTKRIEYISFFNISLLSIIIITCALISCYIKDRSLQSEKHIKKLYRNSPGFVGETKDSLIYINVFYDEEDLIGLVHTQLEIPDTFHKIGINIESSVFYKNAKKKINSLKVPRLKLLYTLAINEIIKQQIDLNNYKFFLSNEPFECFKYND